MPTKKKVTPNGIHLKKNKKGELIWHIESQGNIIAEGGESYKRKQKLLAALQSAQSILYEYFVLENQNLFFDDTVTVKK